MKLDPKVEKTTREMLYHAGRGELDELTKIVQGIGDDKRLLECLELCVKIAAHVAVDVLGPDWPGDAGLRRMAEAVVKAEDEYDLDAEQVFDYLKKAALGFQPANQVFPSMEQASVWPIVMTASLLLSYTPKGIAAGEYLDGIEEGIQLAESIPPTALPSMIVHAHRLGPRKAK